MQRLRLEDPEEALVARKEIHLVGVIEEAPMMEPDTTENLTLPLLDLIVLIKMLPQVSNIKLYTFNALKNIDCFCNCSIFFDLTSFL